MRRALTFVLSFLALPACWGKGESTVTRSLEFYLPYREPGLHRDEPTMFVLVDEPDGPSRLLPNAARLPAGHPPEWGRSYMVNVSITRNPTWGTSTRIVEEVFQDTVAIDKPFTLAGMSAPYFGADKRSFVDEKSFVCADPQLCAALDEAIGSGATFDLKMKFGAEPAAPLVVMGVDAP